MKKKHLLFILVLLVFLTAATANADAPVWKVTKGEHYLFIGGTIHVLAKSDYPLPAAFEETYRESDMVVFETDMQKLQTPEFRQLLLEKVVYADDRSLKTVLNAKTYQQLEQHLSGRGIPAKNLIKFKPGMAAMTLTIIELQRLGLVGAGVDEFFSMRAVNDQKTTGQLETVQEQAAFIANMGDGREDELIVYTLRQITELPELMKSMKDAWRNGDNTRLEEIALTPIKKDFPEVYDDLIAKRNLDWIPKIETMLQTGEVELILVGALHLVGEDGVLAGLAARGCKIEMQ